MRCSIVILNWNGAEMLRRFLPSVLQYCPTDAEVVVADNGSTDTSVQVLRECFPEARTILFAENFGFAEGYNRALAEIDSEYVVLLNSDVEVTEHWLEPLLDYMDAHPEVAAVQPKVLAYYDKEKKKGGRTHPLRTCRGCGRLYGCMGLSLLPRTRDGATRDRYASI